MNYHKQFETELMRLFRIRTHWLRSVIGKASPGKPPVLNKRKLNERIRRLQTIASLWLVKHVARDEFQRLIDKKKQWHPKKGKGWGIEEKKRTFDKWFESQISFPNCIYIFWAGRKCKYVGRTIRGKGRPQSHFEKFWFLSITRIDIYSTSRASEVSKLECLAIHRFNPSENKKRAAGKKWTKKCPVCKVHKLIYSELKKIFKLK
jgi:hypothetical protein